MSKNAKHKVDVIYDLRAAAEEKGRAEKALDEDHSPEHKDALLDAQVALEETTLRALDVCDECGHVHAAEDDHPEAVISVHFRAPRQR